MIKKPPETEAFFLFLVEVVEQNHCCGERRLGIILDLQNGVELGLSNAAKVCQRSELHAQAYFAVDDNGLIKFKFVDPIVD